MNQQIEQTMDALLNAVTIKPDGWMIVLSIGAALLFAAIMWGAYRLANGAEAYQPKFAATLIALALISTILMDLIQSNLALSLGMLGSLSIVRFRTNIKDPRDIGFIFWAMAIGIASATQSYLIGIIGSVVLGAVMILTKKHGEAERQLLLVIRGSNTDLDGIQNVVKSCTRTNLVKQHMAFLIRTVSSVTGRYVSVENDEEFSIALLAFTEAVKRYDKEKGTFLTFAKLVIESRLKTYLSGKKKEGTEVSLEAMQEEGMDFAEEKKKKTIKACMKKSYSIGKNFCSSA